MPSGGCGEARSPVTRGLCPGLGLSQAGLAPRLASSKRKASQPEKLLPTQAVGEDQREVLRRPCRAHGLEPGNAGLQASRLCRDGLPCPQDLVPRRCHQHRLLCERIIREQQQLMQGEARAGLACSPVPPGFSARAQLSVERLGLVTFCDPLPITPSQRSGCVHTPPPLSTCKVVAP